MHVIRHTHTLLYIYTLRTRTHPSLSSILYINIDTQLTQTRNHLPFVYQSICINTVYWGKCIKRQILKQCIYLSMWKIWKQRREYHCD